MKIIRFIEKKLLPQIVVSWYNRKLFEWTKRAQCQLYPIKPQSAIDNVRGLFSIKDLTWEPVNIAERFEFSRACTMYFRFEAQSIVPLPGAIVCDKSDIVIWSNEVVWDKYYNPNFSKIIPLDKNMYHYERGYVWLRKYKTAMDVPGKVLSLTGVHASVWAHFITQYLPKLYYAEKAGLLEDNVTILINRITDSNIREILYEYTAKYPSINLIEAQDNIYYRCEELFYMPSASHLDDHELYLQTCDIIIPQVVQEVLKERLVNPLIEEIKNNPSKHNKLYIVRRNTSRKIDNWPEIEDYFIEQGFYLVEGSSLTLKEKADLFYHADYIVGAECSGWSNIMFCKRAKGLILSNISQSINSFANAFAKIGNVDLLRVTGEDHSGSSQYVDCYIPLEKVKAAYNELLRM